MPEFDEIGITSTVNFVIKNGRQENGNSSAQGKRTKSTKLQLISISQRAAIPNLLLLKRPGKGPTFGVILMTISGIKMAPKAKKDTRIGTSGEQLPTAKSTSKKRIVSSPRIKGEPKIGVSVRLTPTQIQRLDELREPQKLSRTNLIVNAVERCLVDGIWQKTRKAQVQKDSSPQNYRPPKELVSATNLMLELAFVLETLLKKPDPDSPQFEQASRIYLDARESLAQLKNDLAC